MAATRKRSSVSVTQFIALIVVTIALSLVVDLGRKVALYRHLQREEARLEQEIELRKARQDDLQSFKERVQTDEFVDEWARREWKMLKPGETGVVPMLPEAPLVPQSNPQEESDSSEGPRRKEWWQLLFDRLPGLRHLASLLF